MKKWEISCNGWYPYCPFCKQESFYRTPICMNCGELLIQNDNDMDELKSKNKELYNNVMRAYYRKIDKG